MILFRILKHEVKNSPEVDLNMKVTFHNFIYNRTVAQICHENTSLGYICNTYSITKLFLRLSLIKSIPIIESIHIEDNPFECTMKLIIL